MQIIGHHTLRARLADLISQNKFPQTSIFHGLEGVGKKRVVLEVAARLLCLSGKQAPCWVCASCERILVQTHPDVFFIEPTPPKSATSSEKTTPKAQSSWTIKIEQLNELKTKLIHHPLMGNHQIVIIDEADKMTVSAANTLLKTLEEPRSSQIFILITSRLGHVLATLRSRSVKFHFSALELSDVQKILSQCNDEARKEIDPAQLEFFYRCFQGSVSMILRAFESGLDLKVFDSLLQAQGQFNRTSPLIKDLIRNVVDLDVFLHCFRRYCLDQQSCNTGGADVLREKLDQIQRAEQQLAKHIPADFVLENLFL